MTAYLVKRLLLIIPTLILITLIVFLLVQLIPGEVVELMLADIEYQTGQTALDEIRAQLGLDVPIHIQYVRWIGDVLRGDLGKSLWTGIPLTEQIKPRIPVSAELGILSLLVSLIIALPLGVYSAIRQDTIGDYVARSFAILFIALPAFWVGTLIMVFPSIWWGWMPNPRYISFIDNPAGNLGQFMIPAAILGMYLSGTTMRMTRTMMLEVLRQDYIRTAWSKGLKERVVIMRHALKNASIPVVTMIGLTAPFLIGGTVVMEQIFALPGLGQYLLESLQRRDYVAISGINLIIAVVVLVANLLVDLTYAFLDPRIRYR